MSKRLKPRDVGLNQRTLARYCELKRIKAYGLHKSLYESVCEALSRDGLHKPPAGSARAFCIMNAKHIITATGISGQKMMVRAIKAEKAAKRSYDRSASMMSGPVTVTRPEPEAPSVPIGVESNSFLWSYEWRRVRMQALKKYGARCQCCGASPSDGAKMNVDHIKPRKLFPQLALDIDNLQVLCEECNHGKGNWDTTDWRPQEEGESQQIDHLKSILNEDQQ